MSAEPLWLTRRMVDTIHAELLREHGGAPGVRDEDLIESALVRPVHRYHYQSTDDMADLAAAYLFGLVKNHGYIDGNKRVGFAAAAVFLLLNGLALTATEVEAFHMVMDVAAGAVPEADLAAWFRRHTRPEPSQ